MFSVNRFLIAIQYYFVASTITASPLATTPDLGTFKGTSINATLTGTTLPVPVHAWLGIDYATQPVGPEGRFHQTRPIKPSNGTKDASQYGKICVQEYPGLPDYAQDEACLNMNIFRPVNSTNEDKLPIFLWIHGGSFVIGSARSFDGAAFVSNSKAPVMVVTFNYRLSSLGFLPSPLFERENLLNLGLLDQHELLIFVQKYISHFGGDPDRVTLGGRSAGGHSVGIHYFHNYTSPYTTPKPLFSQAVMQSGSVTARGFPNASYPLYARQYATYLSAVGCKDDNSTLSCLRNADIELIKHAGGQAYLDSEYAITWPFQPTIGGPLLERPGSKSGIDGTFYHIPVITTNVPDEAKLYTSENLTTNNEFLDFVSNQLPGLNATDMAAVESLYPDPLTDAASPYTNSPNSTQYNRISAACTDHMYVCPGQETAFRTSSASVPTYKLRFATNNSFPSWQGIPHTADTKYTWADPKTQYPEVGHVLLSYFASFVVTGDPNKLRAEGTAEWPVYQPVGGKQLVIESNVTRVEEDVIRKEQCAFWRDPERAPRLNR